MEERYEEEILIEKYLEGQLDQKEQKAFQEQFGKSGSFRAKVEDMKVLYDGFHELQVQNMVTEIKQWKEGNNHKINRTKGIVRRLYASPWAIAASILLIVGIGLFSYADHHYNNQKIAQKNYVPLDAQSILRGLNKMPATPTKDSSQVLIKNGFQAMIAGKNDEAIRLFSAVPSTDNSFSSSLFYLAHAYYKAGNYDLAVVAFSKVIEGGDSRYVFVAEINFIDGLCGKGAI